MQGREISGPQSGWKFWHSSKIQRKECSISKTKNEEQKIIKELREFKDNIKDKLKQLGASGLVKKDVKL